MDKFKYLVGISALGCIFTGVFSTNLSYQFAAGILFLLLGFVYIMSSKYDGV